LILMWYYMWYIVFWFWYY